MDFDTYYKALGREERKLFAERARTSTEYIEIHLLPRRKIPQIKKMKALAAAGNGAIAYEDVVRYFYLADVA